MTGVDPLVELAAGSCAGLVADSTTHPIDTLRARLMVQRTVTEAAGRKASLQHYRGLGHAFLSVARTEGIGGFYRGFGIVAFSTVPAHALYFGGYEMAKRKLTPAGVAFEDTPSWVHFCAGLWAELCGALIWTPQDVIKQRLQVQRAEKSDVVGSVKCHSLRYRHSYHAFRTILSQEGPRGLFKGFVPALVTYGPFVGIYFAVYEKFKVFVSNKKPSNHASTKEELAFPIHLTGGFLAGGFASMVTTPMDVVKTRLQVQSSAEALPYRNAFDCVGRMLREEGVMAFTKGMSARTLWIAPSTAITMAAYEYFKNALG